MIDRRSGDDAIHISEFTPQYATQSAADARHNPSAYATFAAHIDAGADRVAGAALRPRRRTAAVAVPRPIPAAHSSGARLHVVDHHLTEARARDLRRAVEQAGEVVGHLLRKDRLLHRTDDQVGGRMPAHVAQHHLGREDLRAGIDVILAGVLRRRAVGRLEHRHRVAHVRARGDADAADLRGERVGDVVAVQVERRDHRVLGRAQQDLLQEGVGDDVLDDDLLAALGILELAPRPAVDLDRLELLLREAVAPVAEARPR